MIEYVNLFVLLTMFGSTCYVYHELKKFFYLISIFMDSKILDQSELIYRDMWILKYPSLKEVAKRKLTLK